MLHSCPEEDLNNNKKKRGSESGEKKKKTQLTFQNNAQQIQRKGSFTFSVLREEGYTTSSVLTKPSEKATVHMFSPRPPAARLYRWWDGSSRRFNATRHHLWHTALSGVVQTAARNIPGSSGGTSLSPSPVEQVNDVVIIHLCWSLIGLKRPPHANGPVMVGVKEADPVARSVSLKVHYVEIVNQRRKIFIGKIKINELPLFFSRLWSIWSIFTACLYPANISSSKLSSAPLTQTGSHSWKWFSRM